jgi:hypothetical protein
MINWRHDCPSSHNSSSNTITFFMDLFFAVTPHPNLLRNAPLGQNWRSNFHNHTAMDIQVILWNPWIYSGFDLTVINYRIISSIIEGIKYYWRFMYLKYGDKKDLNIKMAILQTIHKYLAKSILRRGSLACQTLLCKRNGTQNEICYLFPWCLFGHFVIQWKRNTSSSLLSKTQNLYIQMTKKICHWIL